MIKQWTFQGELVDIEQGRNLEERMIRALLDQNEKEQYLLIDDLIYCSTSLNFFTLKI